METSPLKTPICDQHAALKLEYLELKAQIAEMHRAYIVDLKTESPARRAEMYAREKRLELELHKFNVLARAEKIKAGQFKGKSTLNILIAKVEAAGMGHLVKEAQSESFSDLENAGLLQAYRS